MGSVSPSTLMQAASDPDVVLHIEGWLESDAAAAAAAVQGGGSQGRASSRSTAAAARPSSRLGAAGRAAVTSQGYEASWTGRPGQKPMGPPRGEAARLFSRVLDMGWVEWDEEAGCFR